MECRDYMELEIQERKTIMDLKTLGVCYDPEEMTKVKKIWKEGLDIQRVGQTLLASPGRLLRMQS